MRCLHQYIFLTKIYEINISSWGGIAGRKPGVFWSLTMIKCNAKIKNSLFVHYSEGNYIYSNEKSLSEFDDLILDHKVDTAFIINNELVSNFNKIDLGAVFFDTHLGRIHAAFNNIIAFMIKNESNVAPVTVSTLFDDGIKGLITKERGSIILQPAGSISINFNINHRLQLEKNKCLSLLCAESDCRFSLAVLGGYQLND